MHKIVVGVLVASALALAATTSALAYGTRHAFCLQGGEFYQGLNNCTFDTYEQCQATASGQNMQCLANPYYDGPSDDPYAYRNRGRPFPPNYIPVPPNASPRY
jgi:Protein of unknown function (DUF3551)